MKEFEIIPRVIPSLLIKGKGLYKGKAFKNHRYLGDPINAVKIFNDKKADELFFFDIEANKKQVASDKITARQNKQKKDKLFNSESRIEKLIKDVEQEAGRNLSIEEQVEIEKGNLPEIDFTSVFMKKYSYLFD